MGREVRRVPPDWEHPKEQKWNPFHQRSEERYKPLHDYDYETAMREWLDELNVWMAGEFERVRAENPDLGYDPALPLTAFEAWHGGPPDPDSCRPRWTPEQSTHFQLYENVSEGTPLSPVFATKVELVDWIVEHGDGWDRPVSRAAAEQFVIDGYAPSMVFDSRVGVVTGVESAGLLRDAKE